MRAWSRALTISSLAATAACATLFAATPAEAACKRMGFLVNDYGKEGPTRDAQELLDKHVAEWAAQNGIKNYTIGKKDVKCELYLNLILFDEHTCTASANVCWDEPGKEKPAKAAKTDGDKADRKQESSKPASADKKSTDASTEAKVEKAAEKQAEPPPAAAIETGTVTPSDASAPAAPATATEDDAAARAAAAAERAAEAAERAAAAAEKAAAAAKQTQEAPSQMEMPGYGAGQPADVAPVTPVEPKP